MEGGDTNPYWLLCRIGPLDERLASGYIPDRSTVLWGYFYTCLRLLRWEGIISNARHYYYIRVTASDIGFNRGSLGGYLFFNCRTTGRNTLEIVSLY